MIQFVEIETTLYPISSVKFRRQVDNAGKEKVLLIADKLHEIDITWKEFISFLENSISTNSAVLDLNINQGVPSVHQIKQ